MTENTKDILLKRIDAAITRITSGSAPMRIPADQNDPDIVLVDCANYIRSLLLQPQAVPDGVPGVIVKRVLREVEDAKNPKGMSPHDGKVRLLICDVERMLAAVSAAPQPAPDEGKDAQLYNAAKVIVWYARRAVEKLEYEKVIAPHAEVEWLRDLKPEMTRFLELSGFGLGISFHESEEALTVLRATPPASVSEDKP